MVSFLNSQNAQFATAIDGIQNALTKTETEMSSGLAVSTPSDAPDQVSAILQLHADIAQNTEIQQNLNNAKSQVTTADQSLSTASNILDQVAALASQGLGLNASSDSRSTLAAQVQSLMQEMVSISNTQQDGQYIFSGDSNQNPSYQYDPNSPTGVDRLQVSSATQQVQDGSGGSFAVASTANQIFDARDSSDNPTTGNVFAAMNAVRTALLNNDTTGLETAQSSLQSAVSYLSNQQAFYGNAENRITSSLTQAANTSTSLQTDLSNRQDADETSVILQLQQYSTTLQAAIAAQAKMPTTTLFDDLPQ